LPQQQQQKNHLNNRQTPNRLPDHPEQLLQIPEAVKIFRQFSASM
jgi:hypothetical protein